MLQNLEKWLGLAGTYWPVTSIATVVVVVLGVLTTRFVAARIAQGLATASRRDMALTFLAAGLATMVTAEGMWTFFSDVGIDNTWYKAATFAFLEVAMLVEALRSRRKRLGDQARRNLLQAQIDVLDPEVDADKIAELRKAMIQRSFDVDGAATWVFALLSGIIAATKGAHLGLGVMMLRLVAPLTAAFLWERALISQIRDVATTSTMKGWLEKVVEQCRKFLVKIGWMDPTDADVNDLDAQRRLTKLVRVTHDFHCLPTEVPGKPSDKQLSKITARREKLSRKLRAAMLDAQARKLLATPEQVAEFQQRLALLFAVETATSPQALSDVDPWRPATVAPAPLWTEAEVGTAHDALEHLEAVSSEHHDERSTVSGVSAHEQAAVSTDGRPREQEMVSIPPARERRSKPRADAAVSTTVQVEQPPAASEDDGPRVIDGELVEPLEVPKVPDPYAAGFIAVKLMKGETDYTFGTHLPRLFDTCNSGQTARRWKGMVIKSLPELAEQSETVSA